MNTLASPPPLPRRAVVALGTVALTHPAAGQDAQRFLLLSQAITGHAPLSPLTAQRILAAMTAADPEAPSTLSRLGALVAPGQSPEVLLAAADAAGLKAAAMAVVSSWYTGSVGAGPNAQVVTYADALMFRPVADAIPVPTYCAGGPLWWTAAPPALQRER